MARPRGSKKQREQAARLMTGGGRLVAYLRVSTEQQHTNGHSLSGQETRLREFCARQGYEVAALLQDVESGSHEDRDGLREAQRMVEDGQAEGLVFSCWDRATRGQIHGAHLAAWATSNGFTVVSADEGVLIERGTLKDEYLALKIAIAEIERQKISKRTRQGLAAAKAKGVTLGSPQRRQCADPAIQFAIERRRQGATLQAIRDDLDAQGVRGARGGALTAKAVWTWIERCAPAQGAQGGDAR